MPSDPLEFAVIPPELDEGNAEEGFFKLSAIEALQVKAILTELIARQCESLTMYDELPQAEEFHRSNAFIRIVRGSNRAGKTLSSAVEVARAVTGQDPHGKYPARGMGFVFGLDGKHLGLTIFEKLFQPGAFRMIRDLESDEWRTYRPWQDEERKAEALPAPPLIPPRHIKSIAWEEKKTKIPKCIEFHSGWTLWFISSLARMPQGQGVQLWWIDEEVENEKLVAELTGRCGDAANPGVGIWSATPQAASRQLLDLHERAEDNPEGDVKEWKLLIADNPYLSADIKRKMFETWSEDERRARWEGEYAYSQLIVYPEFAESVHGFVPEKWGLGDINIPFDWALYAAVDPGRQVCASAFWAVPPPKVGDFAVMYDELYIQKCDAATFGTRFAAKVKGRVLEAIVIDHQAGRMHEAGGGRTIEEQYREALIHNKVETRNKGCYFTWGSSDVQAGILAFRDYLRVRPNGQPKFYVLLARCPNFVREARRYRFKKDRDGVVQDQVEKKNDHLMDDVRYLAMFAPAWRQPAKPKAMESGAVRSLRAKKNRKKEKGQEGGGGVIRLG